MVKETVNSEKAGQFFNSISDTYKSKYSPENVFHYYFFTERLEKATKNLELKNKKILDIGAGTGDLYDYLISKEPSINYFATDIAEGMLEHSNIPKERRFLGNAKTLDIPHDDFDCVFMLGVSTYLNDSEIRQYLDFIKKKSLIQNTDIIITFTNKCSIDNFFRTVLKPFVAILPGKRSVLSQKILIKKYTIEEVENLIEKDFQLIKVEWLNHTIFPFNLLFKNWSVALAEKLDKLKNPKLLSLFSSDFIVKFRIREKDA